MSQAEQWGAWWARLPVRQQSTKIRCPNREPRRAAYPAAIPLSSHTLVRLAELIRAERARRRSRGRRFDSGRQALLVLAHLRNGDTHTRLAARFCISYSTAWRYVREAVDLLAALADDLHAAGERAARLAYEILDGTLVPINRVANRKPYYSGCEDLGVPSRSRFDPYSGRPSVPCV